MNKPKVIKDFSKLAEELQEEILNAYPDGYQDSLILFTDKDGKYVHALPYETEDRYYLLKMPPPNIKKIKMSEDDANEETDEADDYTDLDTMQIGGNKKQDEDEEYD